MKKVTNIIFLIMILCTGCVSKRAYFLRLSDKITKDFATKKAQKNNLFKEAREKVYNQALFLKESKTDTIYILEKYNLVLATAYGRIWTRTNNVTYEYRRKKGGNELNYVKNKVFSNNQVDLITKWDTLKIRNEERNPCNSVTNNIIRAYRCLPNENLVSIDEITFLDFFNPKTDD